jgi:hypothetical protein
LPTQVQANKINDEANGDAYGNDEIITDRQDVTEDEEEEEEEYDDEEEGSTGPGGNENPATAIVMS